MLLAFPKCVTPNLSFYPDVAVAGKLGDNMKEALRGMSNATSGMVIKRFMDFRIKLGEETVGNIRRVTISTGDLPKLQEKVVYVTCHLRKICFRALPWAEAYRIRWQTQSWKPIVEI